MVGFCIFTNHLELLKAHDQTETATCTSMNKF